MTARFTLLAFALGAAWLGLATGCKRPAESARDGDPAAAATVERVTVGKPQRKTLVLTTTQPARIEAFEETPLYAKLAAFVDKIYVDIGDRVALGQTLVTLRIPELVDEVAQRVALVAQAEAEIDQAEAHVESVQAAAETARAQIAEAKAGILRATADRDRWAAELARYQQLAASGSVTDKLVVETRQQLEAANAARQQAEAAVDSAQAAAREADANVRQAEADSVAAAARLRVAEADLARARTMLGYAEIKAPFAGVVTQRSIDTGHFVQPAGAAGAPLLVVVSLDRVRVFLDVPEMEAAYVDVGDSATLSVQAFRGQPLEAPVARTSWSLDPANRSLRAEIDVDNEAAALRPGMYALGTIELARRDDALVLPASAIVRTGGEALVCCVEAGKIARRPVELGLRSGPDVEVLSGVDESSLVVIAKAEALTDGQQVAVIQPPK